MGGQSAISPLLLRLALGITFLWAGLGKVMIQIPVKGEQAAILANMGVVTPDGQVPINTPAPHTPDTSPPSTGGRPTPSEPLQPTKPSGGTIGLAPTTTIAPVLAVLAPPDGNSYTAADFTEPVQVRRLYGLSLLLCRAANPGQTEAGVSKMPLWPAVAAEGKWPMYLAWAVTLTELFGGLCLLVGLGTRVFAFMLAGTMLGAMWLTEIGPAMQSGKAVLGLLPNYATYEPRMSPDGYVTVLWQFALLAIALSLTATGAGRFSLDAGFAKGGKPQAPKPKPAAPMP